MLDFIANQGWKNIGVIYDNNPLGQQCMYIYIYIYIFIHQILPSTKTLHSLSENYESSCLS